MRAVNVGYLLFALLVTVCGCRKQQHESPVVQLLLTKNLEDDYLWHGLVREIRDGRDTMVYGVVADGIGVENDSMIYLESDREAGWTFNIPPSYYRYRWANDTEIVYRSGDATITYKIERNVVIWFDGERTLFGVPGATAKWQPIHDVKLEAERRWHRQKWNNMTSSQVVTLPDTMANVFLLFQEISGAGKSSLSVSGADSTGIIYRQYRWGVGPHSYGVWGTIMYVVTGDSVKMDYKEQYATGRSFTCSSYR